MAEQVSILHESRMALPSPPGVSKDIIILTYAGAGMVARTVYIDPDHDSPEERSRIIGEDLKAARTLTARTIDIE